MVVLAMETLTAPVSDSDAPFRAAAGLAKPKRARRRPRGALVGLWKHVCYFLEKPRRRVCFEPFFSMRSLSVTVTSLDRQK
eukprot:COSAG04_NODE_13020_length_623_cov_1.458015_1_plen_80_part_01